MTYKKKINFSMMQVRHTEINYEMFKKEFRFAINSL